MEVEGGHDRHVGPDDLPDRPAEVTLEYQAPWRDEGLAAALAAVRDDELRRRVSLVGPHRDEVALAIGELPARTHASQGEQRSLALALRLGSHDTVARVMSHVGQYEEDKGR